MLSFSLRVLNMSLDLIINYSIFGKQPTTDTLSVLNESLLVLRKHLVIRIDTIWAARQQALYLYAFAATPEADPAILRVLQRRYYNSSLPSAVSPRSCPWHLHILKGGAASDSRHSH